MGNIYLDDMELPMQTTEAFTFTGPHSKGDLSGLRISVTVPNGSGSKRIVELLGKQLVEVKDPFANRAYSANVIEISNSYQVGGNTITYCLEVKELDVIPNVTKVKINNIVYNVVRYDENEENGEVSGYTYLLMLEYDEFLTLNDDIMATQVSVNRVGYDSIESIQRVGMVRWSEHISEKGKKHYLQYVHLFPINLPDCKLDLASGTSLRSLQNIVQDLTARFDALLQELKGAGSINTDVFEKIMLHEPSKLIPERQYKNIGLQFRKIEDANKYFEF